nr:MAG TPA: putative transcriptional regulator [Caudoviricetes sp.]
MTTKARLEEFIRFKGLATSRFESMCHLSNGYVRNLKNQVGDEKLNNILSAFPELSKVWLLTGEGEMLNTDAPVVEQRKQESEENEGKLIPLLPLSAEGGSLDGFDNLGVSLPDCEVIYSPIKDADMAITVSGKSMEPDYPEGCRVVVKRIDHALFIEWGREYVLDTANGIVLKTLEPSDDPNFIRCTSLNPDQRRYAPFEIPKESVRGVYRVHLMMGRK